MASINPIFSNGNGKGTRNIGGVGITLSGVPTPATPVTEPPKQLFDISVLSGLRDSDKYLGKNRVSDIKESYETYLTGTPIGRGGQYAVDAARRYGTSIVEAARGYLVTVGLPTLAEILPVTRTTAITNDPLPDLPDLKLEDFFPLPVGPASPTNTTTSTEKEKNPFEVLADILPTLFGNAVYNPPLQSQAYGYTPATTETPLTQSGGSGIGMVVILGVVGIIGYFLYKRFAK